MADSKITMPSNVPFIDMGEITANSLHDAMYYFYNNLTISEKPVLGRFYWSGWQTVLCYRYLSGTYGFIALFPWGASNEMYYLVRNAGVWTNRYIHIEDSPS